MKTFLDVMDLWPSDDDLALDLGLKYSRVLKWRVRRKIPGEVWPTLMRAAKKRGYRLTADALMECMESHEGGKEARTMPRNIRRARVAA